MSLYSRLKELLESKNVTVVNTNVYDACDEISKIEVEEENTNITEYSINRNRLSNINKDTTRKLQNLKNKLLNNLQKKNVCVSTSENIQQLIEKVGDVVGVNKSTLTLTVDDTVVMIGDTVKVDYMVTNPHYSNITGSIKVTVDSVTTTHNIQDLEYIPLVFDESGVYTVKVEYLPNMNGATGDTKHLLFIVKDANKTDTTMSWGMHISTEYSITYGESVSSSGVSCSDDYDYVGSVFYLYEDSVEVDTVAGVNNLLKKTTITPGSVGVHYYLIVFKGDSTYNPCCSEVVTVTVSKHDSILGVVQNPEFAYKGDTVKLTVTGAGEVSVSKDGTTLVKDNNTVEYSFTLTEDTSYIITDSGNDAYMGRSVEYPVLVSSIKSDAPLTLNVPNTCVKWETCTVTGKGVEGVQLDLIDDVTGVVLCSTTSGSLSYSFTPAQNYSFYLKSHGTDRYNETITEVSTGSVIKRTGSIIKSYGTSESYYNWKVCFKIIDNLTGENVHGCTIRCSYNDGSNHNITLTEEDDYYYFNNPMMSGTLRILSLTLVENTTYNETVSNGFTIPVNSPQGTEISVLPTSISFDGDITNLKTGNTINDPANTNYLTTGSDTRKNLIFEYVIDNHNWYSLNGVFSYFTLQELGTNDGLIVWDYKLQALQRTGTVRVYLDRVEESNLWTTSKKATFSKFLNLTNLFLNEKLMDYYPELIFRVEANINCTLSNLNLYDYVFKINGTTIPKQIMEE